MVQWAQTAGRGKARLALALFPGRTGAAESVSISNSHRGICLGSTYLDPALAQAPAANWSSKTTSATPPVSRQLQPQDDHFHHTTYQYRLETKRRMSGEDSTKAALLRRANAARMVDKLGINWDQLPKLPFWNFTDNSFRLSIADTIIRGQQLLEREFTPEERDAVAYHAAKKGVTLSYATPVSLVGAYFAQRRGRDTFRFPFWTPKPTNFDPGRFPFPNRTSPYILDGVPAMRAWHVLRGACYYFFIKIAVSAFISLYATSVEVAGMSRDVRLQNVANELKKRGPARGGRLPPPEDPSIRDADSQYGNSQYGGYSMSESTENTESTGAYDSNTEDNSAYSKPAESYSPPQPRRQQPAPTQTYAPPPSEGIEGGGLFDDASPVAPVARGRPASSSGGSSWDQIRRRAAQSGSGVSQSGGESQASEPYTQADRDREQAQREFDALLERERQADSADRYSRRN